MKKYLLQEKKRFLIVLLVFLFGLLLGSLATGTSNRETTAEFSSSLENFFSVYMLQGSSKTEAFRLSLVNHSAIAFWLLLSSLHPLLLAVGFFQVALKGFRAGFAIASLCQCYIGKGILLSVLSIIPVNFVFLAALCFYLSSQMQFLHDRKNVKKGIVSSDVKKQIYLRYGVTTAIFLLWMLLCATIDGYLIPTLLQPLCGLFL